MGEKSHPWLIAVSAGRWQKSGIRSAVAAGIRVLALDSDKEAAGFAFATKSVVVDIKDPQAVLAAVESVGIIPNGVVSFASEAGMTSSAVLRERYGLAGPNRETTIALSNKVRQREIWQESGIDGPRWRQFDTVAEGERNIKELGFPCIVKPSDSAGSRGVTKLDSREGLNEAAEIALYHSNTETALVESFMPGIEYTIETFGDGKTIHVLAVTEKVKVSSEIATVARELKTPRQRFKADIVSDAAVKALSALDYMSGPGHVEVILNDQGQAGLVEAAGRGGGFMVFERLVEKASGFDVVSATALQAIGWNTPKIVNKRRSVLLRFFPSRKGIVTEIKGFEDADKILGVEAESFVNLGQHIEEVKGDGDRLGYILSEGPNVQVAEEAADLAESLIRIRIE